jgi:hypothetical protein
MLTAHDHASQQFYRWERLGRGWQVHSYPVRLEPAFVPFQFAPAETIHDDGKSPTLLSSMYGSFTKLFRIFEESTTEATIIEEDATPEPLERLPACELQILLARDFDSTETAFRQFIVSIFPLNEPCSFELFGTAEGAILQVSVSSKDAQRVKNQISAYFPKAVVFETENAIINAWFKSKGKSKAIIEFGLGREFMFPLASSKIDPFVGIAAQINSLNSEELAVFQVLFEPVQAPWRDNIFYAVNHSDGKPLFVNSPELSKAGTNKSNQPLFAVIVRIATKALTPDRTWDLARNLACALNVYADPLGNELIPLQNDEYTDDEHEVDFLLRQTRRSGMILSLDELLGFVHLPSTDVPKVGRDMIRSKSPPSNLTKGILLGHNLHAGKKSDVRLSSEQRVRHVHIIGASGTGKTTLLFNLIKQDIEAGQGLALLDPHGDLVDRVLGIIPEERIKDVVLIDPADESYSIGFNILSAHSDLEKHLLASDLVSVFQRLSATWGDQMGSVLQNAILAFLESKKGGTLADLRRFLIEPKFRADFLSTVDDPEVLYYWQKAFPQLTGNRSIGSVLTRLEAFLAPKPLRYMVSQPKNRLDFGEIMDNGRIFLAKLSEGLLGKENSYLLGALFVAKFQQLAMSRQAQNQNARRDFWFYMDEFQNFITPSLAEILTGARKYRMGLILAHHELRQLERDKEVASAVLSNSYTRVVFRVGDNDARHLAPGFSFFEAADLQNLPIGRAICRVERSDHDFNLSVELPDDSDHEAIGTRKAEVIQASKARYGTSKAEVEACLQQQRPPTDKEITPAKEPVSTPPSAVGPIAAPTPKKLKVLDALSSIIPAKEPQPLLKEVTSPLPHDSRPTMKPKSSVSADLGRGGAQHKAIQKRIKSAAQELGFNSTIEKVVLGGEGSVDLYLQRNEIAIGCEITITTTIDHEVGNVQKCIKAGVPIIALISTEEDRLTKLKQSIEGSLGLGVTSGVKYFLPDVFIDYLKSLPVHPEVKPETSRVRRGFKVTRSIATISDAEKVQKEKEMIEAIAEAMQKQKKRT